MDKKPKHKCEIENMMFYFERFEDRLDSIDRTLASQNISLEEHIRRTEILEEEIKPLNKTYAQVQGVLKLLSLGGILAGILTALSRFK